MEEDDLMRLIDADVFIEYLGLNIESSIEENFGEIVTLEDFEKQPTAFEPDKVVNAIDNTVQGITNMQIMMIQDIIKSGGIGV